MFGRYLGYPDFERCVKRLMDTNKMIETRIDGIISRVKYPISNGPLEGLNNMIKVTKRVAYGYRDDEYFFYKLFDKKLDRYIFIFKI